MKFAVTGGCGFIGSHLVEELSKEHEVIVIDDLSSGSLKNIQGLEVEFVKGSITDLKLLKQVFVDVDVVFHLAALVSVQESIKNPIKTNNVNVNGTLNVLIAARDRNVRKVVFSSSCAVYGDTDELPINEVSKPNPKSPYAVTKLAAENYCKVFHEVYGLKTTILRYFNVYGPKQDVNSEYAAVIPEFIRRILNGIPPTIYGDGKQTRDFVFVKDVVRANIVAAKSNKTGIFNIASGKGVSIIELAQIISKIVGKNLKPTHDKPREGDIRHSVGDISKAKKVLGFKPEYSIEEGLKETIEWFKLNVTKS